MNGQQERRDFWRAAFSAPAQLSGEGGTWNVKLRDISLKGALVDVTAGWAGKQDGQYTLRLPLSGDTEIVMQTTAVVHLDGMRVGLRCDGIDVDSITHLRRLVELNAGDESLLDRELAALLRHAEK